VALLCKRAQSADQYRQTCLTRRITWQMGWQGFEEIVILQQRSELSDKIFAKLERGLTNFLA